MLNNPNIPPLTQSISDLTKEFHEGIVLKAITQNNTIIGSVRAYELGDTLYIGKLIVHPTFQGQGIGTKLLQSIEKFSSKPRYELFTSSKSLRNIELYQRMGYKIFKEKELSQELKFIYLEKFI